MNLSSAFKVEIICHHNTFQEQLYGQKPHDNGLLRSFKVENARTMHNI